MFRIRAMSLSCLVFRATVLVVACGAVLGTATAADSVKPAPVTDLLLTRSGADVSLAWTAVTLDAAGNPETVGHYNVYRGLAPDFAPDLVGGSNRIGSPASPLFSDAGAASNAANYFYLVTSVDAAGNESATKPPQVTLPPVLSGSWTDTTIELSWTPAQPAGAVAGYRVYYSTASRAYEFTKDVGSATSTSMTGLALWTNWYFAVVAVDANGNESVFSNEHVDCVAGRVKVRAHDDDYLCWGAANCPPRPGTVQRADGWQLNVPADFPQGNWTKVTVTYTIDSRLCKVGQHGTTDKCGGSNPGGYNPCGDPWDRTAHLYLLMDESCLGNNASCINNDQLELMRAITPFGTDAPPPEGDGVVPPRVLTLDITPYAPLLAGHKWVGAEIGHFVQAGWHVSSEFTFSKRADEVSPDPPAAGIQVIGFSGTPMTVRRVTVPANATKVVTRLFTTGHGGGRFCDGGTKNGIACTTNSQCPGGTCGTCDEFCHRTNRILKNGSPIWTYVPWRECCVPLQPGDPLCRGCTTWNACGYPSCTYDRAGWCPGYIACHKDDPCDQDLDMTAQLPPGGTYDIGYDVQVQTGSWSVSLVLYWY
ncbi:MAG: fibronectin type III domain-containing protein [Acidobacteria bacterium]|nr:fibronectin type III domain-containing protein [Acidobacteriota bacterium]